MTFLKLRQYRGIKRILKFNTGKVYYEHMFIIFAEKYRSTNNINHYISTL